MKIEQTKAILRDLIAYPTISADSNLDIIDFIEAHFRGLGARILVQKDGTGQKANLFASFGPEIDGGVVLSGHSDVVPIADQDWSHDPFEMVEIDGKLFGRGTCDMKGFIACAMIAAEDYADMNLKRPVHFAFTYDEEVGCVGAKALAQLLKSQATKPSLAIIGEPTLMRCIEGHKGVSEYTCHFHGLEGHGSLPDLGVNAVEYAVRYVVRLMELREELKTRAPANSRFDPPWSTINIGALNGGVAHNVIAGKASVEWDFRPIQSSDAKFVHQEIQAYIDEELLPKMRLVSSDASITTQTIGETIGLEPMEENEAKEVVMALRGDNRAETVSFGTEAGIFQSLGMSAVVCGPGSIEQAHKPDEYVEISELESCLSMLERLGEDVLA